MKTLFTVILIYACFLSYSQKRPVKSDPIYFNPEPKTENIFPVKTGNPTAQQIGTIQFNLAKYHKQRQTAFLLGALGVAATTAGFIIKNDELQPITAGVGGAFSLSSIATFWGAEKHLRNAGKSNQ